MKSYDICDALLHWDHNEAALFSLRGFDTICKADDIGLEGYFRFQKRGE